jgi:uncharacterized membrane protein
MTDNLTPTPAPPSPSSAFSDDRQMAIIIYILFLVGFATAHVASLVGLVLAYVNRDGAPEWLRSHYTFQIRTFWIGLLYFCIACACLFVLIGIPMIVAVSVWFIVRCALGINRLLKSEAYPTPESWVF